uniref:Increased DNA methylation 1 C-terminal domain-containing protein n=1 Tax=Kalanchoe fedtschenkoi TaxID=63787 RepID=A0A7N0VH05_KALFE
MSDPRTGIDMIPHMVYNCRSNFTRLDFHGFYTVVLEKDDILTSMASIR